MPVRGPHLGVVVWIVCAGLCVGLSVSAADGQGTAASGRTLAGGGFSAYAILQDGRVVAWGDDLEGQIGPRGGWQASALPVAVPLIRDVTAVAGGENTAYALESDGEVWAWGDGSQDELGDSGPARRDTPRRVAVPDGVVALAAGGFSAYALRRDGTVWAWGSNSDDQLGDTESPLARGRPRPLRRLVGVVAVAAGFSNGYVVRAGGTVWAWGDGTYGQLGDGRCRHSAPAVCPPTSKPVRVRGIRNAVAIAAGAFTGYALLRNGTVWGWGDNELGELGPATRRPYVAAPVRIARLAPAIAIAAGGGTGYALLRNRTVWAWGRGVDGELGDGRAANDRAPTRVDKLSAVTMIAGGGSAAYALDNLGRVWAWGSGAYGQLGNGYLLSLDEPTQVLGLRLSLR